MRDLYKTLELCAKEGIMDYCPEFDEIKSILEYCDTNVKQFKKLCFRSGNESIINELTRQLQDLFVKKQLVDPESKAPLAESKHKLRKIVIFLFANTDATYKYDLRDDPLIAHVFGICPLLPKFLTVALIWELQLDEFFYEVLSFTPCWFAFQYFEAANESLKFVDDPKSVLAMLEQLIRALLLNVEHSAHSQIDPVDQQIILNKLYDQAIVLLRRFNTPDANKIDKMKKRQKDRFWGYTIKHLLQMVLFAFDLYECKVKTTPDSDSQLYKIGEEFSKKQDLKIGNIKIAKEEEQKIIYSLLSTLELNVSLVKMDSFIEWAEVDLTPQLTLQQFVGEMAFRVGERMIESNTFEHQVGSILKQIEIRPKPIEQILAEATIGDVLRSLDDKELQYETKKFWFDELLKRGSATLGNTECLQTMRENLKLMTPDNCKQIMDFLEVKKTLGDLSNHSTDSKKGDENDSTDNDDDDDDREDDSELLNLLLDALKQFKIDDLIKLLEHQLLLFGRLSNGMGLNAEDFEQRSTEFLNKHSFNFSLNEFLLLCFEHPMRMWKKFFDTACHVKEHVNNFCDTTSQTLSISRDFVDHILKDHITHNKTQSEYFPDLLSRLYFLLYRENLKAEFLAKFLNAHIKSLLDKEDYKSLVPIVKALKLIACEGDSLNFDDLTAPMLALMAVVTDLARWNLNTYNETRVELVNTGINFILETMKRFWIPASEKDRQWLSNKIKTTCSTITQFYFQRIGRDENYLPFNRFLFPSDDFDKASVLKFLSKAIFRCTTREFNSLLESPRFHPYIHDAFYQIASKINEDPNPQAIQNFRQAFAKYVIFVRDTLLPKHQDSQDIQRLLRNLLELIALIPGEEYDEAFLETVCLLEDLLKKSIKYEDHQNGTKKVQEIVTAMRDCQAKTVLQKTLNDVNHSQ